LIARAGFSLEVTQMFFGLIIVFISFFGLIVIGGLSIREYMATGEHLPHVYYPGTWLILSPALFLTTYFIVGYAKDIVDRILNPRPSTNSPTSILEVLVLAVLILLVVAYCS